MKSWERNTVPSETGVLSFGERLLLWSIRMWVSGYKDGANVQNMMQHSFELAGLPDLYADFDDVMYLIATTATEDITIWSPDCLYVSDDEHLLLGVVAAWQQGQGKDQGTALLSTWLPMAAIRFAQPSLSKIATTMANQNMVIPSRCSQQSRYAEASHSFPSYEKTATVH